MDALELKDQTHATSKEGSPSQAKPNGADVPVPGDAKPAKRRKSTKKSPQLVQAAA